MNDGRQGGAEVHRDERAAVDRVPRVVVRDRTARSGVAVHAILYDAVPVALAAGVTTVAVGVLIVGGVFGAGGAGGAGAAKPSMVSPSHTSFCTTRHERRPNPPLPQPVPHEFSMMRPALS